MRQTIENTWELNLKTGKVELAQYKRGSFFASSGPEGLQTTETWLMVQKENCKYFLALNKKNAERKGLNLYQKSQRQN